MTVDSWLEQAIADAERRGLPALRPLLEALARSTSALRRAKWSAAEWSGAERNGVDRHDAGRNEAGRNDEVTGDGRVSTSVHDH